MRYEFVVILVILAVIIVVKLNAAKIKGFIGEFKVNLTLKFLGKNFITLSDVLIKNSNNETSQIDHVVLSEYGIFVIETKNYKGWIFGNEQYEYWQQVIFGEKYPFRNPIKQNFGHIYALKNVLQNYPNIVYFPIIVFVGNATLKNITSTIPVIYINQLRKTIKKLCHEKCLSYDEVLLVKDIITSARITEIGSKRKHIHQIKQNLEKMENLICPRCNGKLTLRNGRNGMFYECSNYPKCKFTKPY